jgi:hypothetical protein
MPPPPATMRPPALAIAPTSAPVNARAGGAETGRTRGGTTKASGVGDTIWMVALSICWPPFGLVPIASMVWVPSESEEGSCTEEVNDPDPFAVAEPIVVPLEKITIVIRLKGPKHDPEIVIVAPGVATVTESVRAQKVGG